MTRYKPSSFEGWTLANFKCNNQNVWFKPMSANFLKIRVGNENEVVEFPLRNPADLEKSVYKRMSVVWNG